MEQTSEETNVPEAAAESASAEAPAAPVRRRASRRVTAAAGTVVDADTVAAGAPADAAEASAPAASDASATAASAPAGEAEAAPKKRVSRARKKADAVDQPAAADAAGEAADAAAAAPEAASTDASATQSASAEADADAAPAAKKAPATRRRRQPAAAATAAEPAATAAEPAAQPAADAAGDGDAKTAESEASDASKPADEASQSAADAPAEPAAPRRRNTRTRATKPAAETAKQQPADDSQTPAAEQPAAGDAAADKQSETKQESDSKQESGNNGRGGNENQPRSSRTRQRERKRRGGGDDEPEITEDDVLLPIAGILDVLDNYAFVRTSGYLPGTGDVYVSLGQVKKYGLRKGDAVVGAIRQPREGEGGGRQKYNAIVKVDAINSKPFEENQTRPEFADFTPVHPDERLRLETDASELSTRIVDLFSPVGKGQRGLIVGPHESGKSTTLQQIAHAVAKNQPDAHLMLVLIDERPEEVTALQRTVNGEVIASTFDRPAEDHTTIAELAIERAKRLVELGHDVVVLIDSLTSLARAYNLGAPAAVRVPAGSLDAAAVFPIKRLLSAARNIENGGSLTIVATVSAQVESRLDEALIGELEGVANMQVRLSADAADRRVFPAIDLGRSSTRHEALLTSEAEVKVMNQLRHALADENQEEGLESILKRLGETSSNVEFLALAQRGRA